MFSQEIFNDEFTHSLLTTKYLTVISKRLSIFVLAPQTIQRQR
jgi:hypothetical protein